MHSHADSRSRPNRPLTYDELLERARASFTFARSGDTAGLLGILEDGISPNVLNEKGDSLLILASYHGHVDAVRLLLERGADAELRNDRGQTALMGAAFKGLLPIVSTLLEHGAAPNTPTPDGKTALMFAAMFDKLDVLERLLAAGADLGQADATGHTARTLAEAMGAQRTAARLQQLT